MRLGLAYGGWLKELL